MILIRIPGYIPRPHMFYIARKIGLKKYHSMRKFDLVSLINLHFASVYCAKLYKRNITSTKQYVNTVDPLTLFDLKHPCFELELVPGKIYRYNMHTFYQYMIKTGKFKDPYSDVEFTNHQLSNMDKQLKHHGFMKQSLLSIKTNPKKQMFYKRQHDRENYLLGMDRQIGELLTETCDDLVDKINNEQNVDHTCYHTLIHIFLPDLEYLLEQLKNVDVNYTQNCLRDYISWVKNQNVPLGNIITNLLKNELNHIT